MTSRSEETKPLSQEEITAALNKLIKRYDDLMDRTDTLLAMVHELIGEFDTIKSPKLSAFKTILDINNEDTLKDLIVDIGTLNKEH
jgi:hypothetical protein